MIYLDNGATTKVAKEVVEAMQPYMEKDYGNPSSLHQFGQKAKKALESARITISKSLNADPEEIIFTSGGTESDNIALKGAAFGNKSKGKHIITTKIEHPAILRTCEFLESDGFSVTYLDVDKDGLINLQELEKAITEQTIIVSIIHGNNEIGTIQDIKAIGDICKKNNILFHTDAVQSYTKTDIDTKTINIDLISMSSHKIHGPKGIGALFVKKGTKLAKIIHGGSQEYNIRAGTENIPGIVGFAKAVEIKKDDENKKMEQLRDYMIEELLKIPHTILNGHPKNRLCNNINISFEYVEGESILLSLDQEGIAVSTGSACSSKSLEPSHVLLAIGLKHETAHGSIRFTISRYTTKEEIDITIEKTKKIIEKLRDISPLGK